MRRLSQYQPQPDEYGQPDHPIDNQSKQGLFVFGPPGCVELSQWDLSEEICHQDEEGGFAVEATDENQPTQGKPAFFDNPIQSDRKDGRFQQAPRLEVMIAKTDRHADGGEQYTDQRLSRCEPDPRVKVQCTQREEDSQCVVEGISVLEPVFAGQQSDNPIDGMRGVGHHYTVAVRRLGAALKNLGLQLPARFEKGKVDTLVIAVRRDECHTQQNADQNPTVL